MKQKSFIAVITLVSLDKTCYLSDKNHIESIIKKYNVKVIKTNKLSKYVIDIFFMIDQKTFKNLKLNLKLFLFKGSDVCIQESRFRKKKVIACDMDKTVIKVETIDLIGEKILKNNAISDITKKAMSGEIFYSNSIMQRTKILKGLSVKKIKEIAKYIKLTKDVDIVIKTMNKNNTHTMLISGGYEIFANIIGKKIGFKEIISNKPYDRNGILNGQLKGTIIDGKEKLNYLKKRVTLLKVKKVESMAIGDGQNDIEMIRYAGLGIAWKGFPKVRETADALANHDFKSILYFQGYNDEDIITNL